MSFEQDCVNMLIEDIKQIDAEYIKKGDCNGAYNQFQIALMDRHYDELKPEIMTRLHCGRSFTASIDNLSPLLENKDSQSARSLIELILAFGAQTHLPNGNLK